MGDLWRERGDRRKLEGVGKVRRRMRKKKKSALLPCENP